MLKRFILIAWLSALASLVWATQSGVISKNTELKSEPSPQASAVRSATAGEAITIIKRQGGWYQVTVGTDNGWLDMLAVRMSATSTQSGDSGLGSLVGLVSGTSSNTTVATGVRGIDEVDLQNAQPNAAALSRMESFHVSGASARQFAQQGNLTARPYNYAQR